MSIPLGPKLTDVILPMIGTKLNNHIFKVILCKRCAGFIVIFTDSVGFANVLTQFSAAHSSSKKAFFQQLSFAMVNHRNSLTSVVHKDLRVNQTAEQQRKSYTSRWSSRTTTFSIICVANAVHPWAADSLLLTFRSCEPPGGVFWTKTNLIGFNFLLHGSVQLLLRWLLP